MSRPPSLSDDIIDIADTASGGDVQFTDGFESDGVPSHSGLGTRQGRLRNERDGTPRRNLVHWLVPEGPIIDMYINPQTIKYNYSKNIESNRTKGGFVMQYWGENLTTLDIAGTTGTSGIEGINVLYDIYRNEQLAFDALALSIAAQYNKDQSAGDIFGVGSALSDAAAGGSFLDSLTGSAEAAFPQTSAPSPTLASLAMQVEMYWSGEIYRGYFNDFSVTESADNLGMFEYGMKFTVTQKRGFRRNFLAWHRSAVSGPSNSDPRFGTPHSYGKLANFDTPNPDRGQTETVVAAWESLSREASRYGTDIKQSI